MFGVALPHFEKADGVSVGYCTVAATRNRWASVLSTWTSLLLAQHPRGAVKIYRHHHSDSSPSARRLQLGCAQATRIIHHCSGQRCGLGGQIAYGGVEPHLAGTSDLCLCLMPPAGSTINDLRQARIPDNALVQLIRPSHRRRDVSVQTMRLAGPGWESITQVTLCTAAFLMHRKRAPRPQHLPVEDPGVSQDPFNLDASQEERVRYSAVHRL